MDKTVKNQEDTVRKAGHAVAAKPGKAVYSKPVLHLYGSVSKLTMGTGGSKSDAGNMTKAQSDRSVKEGVVRIGDHPLGIGLYLFEYKREFRDRWGHGRCFGVMADEVAMVMPEAVSVDLDGFKVVDYGMLGVSHPLSGSANRSWGRLD